MTEARAVASTEQNGSSDPSNTAQAILKLAFCATGICVCYLTYGVLQEKLYTENRLGASFVILIQCVTNAVVALIWNRLSSSSSSTKEQDVQQPHTMLFITAGCYISSMVCSNEAIHYVSYPVQVLAKSCKLIPTMLVGQIVERRYYGSAEWMAALLMCTGIVLFHCSMNNNSNDSDNNNSNYGIALLSASLALDGVLGSCQNLLKRQQSNSSRPPNAAETMLYLNFYAIFYLLPLCIVNGQWTGYQVLLSDFHYIPTVLILNSTVAAGQVFIFWTITWFTPVITTIITTTRKFVTILISVNLYGHDFSIAQWCSVSLVFGGLYLAIWNTVQQRRDDEKVKQA